MGRARSLRSPRTADPSDAPDVSGLSNTLAGLAALWDPRSGPAGRGAGWAQAALYSPTRNCASA